MDPRKRGKNSNLKGPAFKEKPDKSPVEVSLSEENFEETLAEEDISWHATKDDKS